MTSQKLISGSRSPIYRDVGFVFDSIEQSEKTFQAERNDPQSAEAFFYTRYANPNVIEAEHRLAELEESKWAVLASSGMSAIDIALSAFHKREETGTWLFFDAIYGGTKDYIGQVLEAKRGIHVEHFTTPSATERFDLQELANTLDRIQPTLLYFEPVSNPLLIVADGDEIIRLANARGITVIVDNTFATSALWRPLKRGADLVIHSVTKYLAGHGNITAGLVCGNDTELRKAAMTYRKLVGHILSPDDAYRLQTQLKTFALRVAKQCENAYKLAKILEAHDKVKNVRYPGLSSHPSHQEAAKIFGDRGFGAMVTFELTGGQAACDAFIANIADHVQYIPTLGDDTSILIHVPAVFGADRFPYPGMIRFSVGFEPYEPLEEHVLQALETL